MKAPRRLPFALIAFLLGLAIVAAALLLVRAQGDTASQAGGNLRGADVGGAFALQNGRGETISNASLKGRWRLIYFGYSYCPDICPTDVQKMAQAVRLLEKAEPKAATRLVPIFITVDPARDTPAIASEFAAQFHPRMLGLSGTPQAVEAAMKAFRIYARKQAGATPDSYLMDHSTLIYLMDEKGAPVQFYTRDQSAAEIAQSLGALVR